MKSTFLFMFSVIAAGLIAVGCDSENSLDNPTSTQDQFKLDSYQDGERILGKLQTELAKVRSATEKYLNIANAIEDGYTDFNVIVEGIGYHYMKVECVDSTFDPGIPELLVYSKNPTSGKMRLVAVEYAVPNTGPLPEGFSGNEDVWVNSADFGVWLLYAWVWYHNPDGMFNPTNPRVHVEEGDITYP